MKKSKNVHIGIMWLYILAMIPQVALIVAVYDSLIPVIMCLVVMSILLWGAIRAFRKAKDLELLRAVAKIELHQKLKESGIEMSFSDLCKRIEAFPTNENPFFSFASFMFFDMTDEEDVDYLLFLLVNNKDKWYASPVTKRSVK